MRGRPKKKLPETPVPVAWGVTLDGRCRGCNLPLLGPLAPYRMVFQETPISHRLIGICPVCGKMACVEKGGAGI